MQKKLIIGGGIALFLLWFAGFSVFAYKINHYQADDNTKTEAIVVLTGGRNRIAEAIKVYNKGVSQKLFISGVEKNTSLEAISQRQAVTFPTEKNAVLLEKQSTNTIENAIQTQAWLKENDIKSIRLVTSNYHIPRSLQEFQHQNPNLKIVTHPVYSDYVAKEWWKSIRSFCLIASEYNKFLYVWLVRRLTF